ncbi:MAG: glycosyltransferase [Magnetococcales bacterium]|nr:glycosyltransferase [Magnetococcales bacterium]
MSVTDAIPRLTLLIPVYNDWDSVHELLVRMDRLFEQHFQTRDEAHKVSVLLVNDCSEISPPLETWHQARFSMLRSIKIMNLINNMGHQIAIAVGLGSLASTPGEGVIIVMDGDGEDRPEDVFRLLQAHREHPEAYILAHRHKRSEGLGFRLGYRLYKLTYFILTGKSITHGNFCLIPWERLLSLTSRSTLWNHLAATINEFKKSHHLLATERGKRFFGKSRMNVWALIFHGLNGISVHLETVSLRLLMASLIIGAISFCVMIALVPIRLFWDWAVPGWASTIGFLSLVIGIQAFLISIFSTFMVLNNRQRVTITPRKDWSAYVMDEQTLLFDTKES